MPTPEEINQPNEKTKEEFMKNNFPPAEGDKLDKMIDRAKKIAEIEKILPPPPSSPFENNSTIAMLMPALAPILSGVSKMVSTMPAKNKLEGNINGGNFSIEVVDEKTRAIAVDILNNLIFDKQQIKKKKD